MKIMLDLNVLLDYIQKRKPHYHYSSIVLSEVLTGRLEGVIPAHALTTIYYIIARHNDKKRAEEAIDWILAHFEVAITDKPVFVRARELPIDDFEDGVVASLAEVSQSDLIVTRNLPDFEDSPISAITPQEFVLRYLTIEDKSTE
ncbi:MAG: PIN domain-containing protein [bacterium]